MLTPEARADGGRRFFLFVSRDDVPSEALVESAWREAKGVTTLVDSETAKAMISKTFPRLFVASRTVDKGAVEGDLRAGKAAYFATDFALAETHLARALAAAYDAPEMLSSSAVILGRLADAAALRYANALAQKQPEAEARAALREFLVRFPLLSPSPTEHAPEVIALWSKLRGDIKNGSLMVNVLPLELERSGTCRLLVNGDELAALPMASPIQVPVGTHDMQVRCGLTAGWLQRVVIGPDRNALKVPVRAMVAARAEPTSGGLVLVSPTEGDSAGLVDVVSERAGFEGAVVVRPGAPKRFEFGVWQSGLDAPTLVAAGTRSNDAILDVHQVQAEVPSPRALSPWPFVIAGTGVAALVGGVVTNVGYLDDRDAGVQDLDATPSVILYGVGGALVVTGVVLFILDVTDDDSSSAATVSGPGRIAIRF